MKMSIIEMRNATRVALEVLIKTALPSEMQTVALHEFVCKVCDRREGCDGLVTLQMEYEELEKAIADGEDFDIVVKRVGATDSMVDDVPKDLVN